MSRGQDASGVGGDLGLIGRHGAAGAGAKVTVEAGGIDTLPLQRGLQGDARFAVQGTFAGAGLGGGFVYQRGDRVVREFGQRGGRGRLRQFG